MPALPLLAPSHTAVSASSRQTEAVVENSPAATAVPSTPPPITTTSKPDPIEAHSASPATALSRDRKDR